ncbi:MAG: carbohydrate-binding family 9-like protein [Paenibacillaceae bacterium]|nr:carbohydrate-binding family 9-like protein [Paenibacillaceae bacterium]
MGAGTNEGYQVKCPYVRYDETVWSQLEPLQLADVVTGGEVAEPTSVRACWDDANVYVRFDCRDGYAVSPYTKRDEPLYDHDVVEVFIDEAGEGTRYLEFEISPFNVLFDAIIDNNNGALTIGLEWDAEGWQTSVREDGEGNRIYELAFPHGTFTRKPAEGVQWRVNFYRIDEEPGGKRHYQAWSPTGIERFHVPARFGTLTFVK